MFPNFDFKLLMVYSDFPDDKQPTTDPPSLETTADPLPSLSVQCIDNTMTVYIPRSIIDNVPGSHLHFSDGNCVGSNHNDTHVRISTELDRCGTTMKVTFSESYGPFLL